MTAAAFAPPARARPTLTRVIVAASLGNALEWFDFLVYGYFAVGLGRSARREAQPTLNTRALLRCRINV